MDMSKRSSLFSQHLCLLNCIQCFRYVDFSSFCRIIKKDQKFERVNFTLSENRSWREKVIGAWGFVYIDRLSSLNCSMCSSFPFLLVFFHLFLQFTRLYLLLTVKESAINVPMNLEARRRITFFANSLFMKMPNAPNVRNMLSFRSVLNLEVSTICFLVTCISFTLMQLIL